MVNFYSHAAGLVVEVDGSVHENQSDDDLKRDQVLQGLMLRVLRIKNQEVFDHLEAVLRKIRDACKEETSPPAADRLPLCIGIRTYHIRENGQVGV